MSHQEHTHTNKIMTNSYPLPETFIINNDPFHKRESANIHFNEVERFARSAVYKRTKDNVHCYHCGALRASDKWAVKYYTTPEKRGNRYFTTKKAALKFAERVGK